MRPLDGDGAVVHPNLYAAGALLRGAVPWRELSGQRHRPGLGPGRGRRDTLGGWRMTVDIRGSLDSCVKCTVCETFCPVAAATPLFPGPKYAGPQSERYRHPGVSVDASLDYCSGCGICTQVCPQGVDIAEINARARAEMKAAHGHAAARPADRAARRARADDRGRWRRSRTLSLRHRPARRALEATLGIHRNAALPELRMPHVPGVGAEAPAAAGRRSARSSISTAARPTTTSRSVARMAVAVLEHNGFDVIVPPQGCCGLPLQSNGAFEPARERTCGRSSRGWRRTPARAHMIVANSTSCGLMLKREAREILGIDDPDLALVGSHTFDICELLRDLHDAGELRTDFQPAARCASPTTSPARAAATASASRRSTCSRSSPSWR